PSVMGTTIGPTNLPPTLPDIAAVIHWPCMSYGRVRSSSRRHLGRGRVDGLWCAWRRGGRGLRYRHGPKTNKGGSCYNQHTGFHRYSPFRFFPSEKSDYRLPQIWELVANPQNAASCYSYPLWWSSWIVRCPIVRSRIVARQSRNRHRSSTNSVKSLRKRNLLLEVVDMPPPAA